VLPAEPCPDSASAAAGLTGYSYSLYLRIIVYATILYTEDLINIGRYSAYVMNTTINNILCQSQANCAGTAHEGVINWQRQ
jgi:hypothetical protein